MQGLRLPQLNTRLGQTTTKSVLWLFLPVSAAGGMIKDLRQISFAVVLTVHSTTDRSLFTKVFLFWPYDQAPIEAFR